MIFLHYYKNINEQQNEYIGQDYSEPWVSFAEGSAEITDCTIIGERTDTWEGMEFYKVPNSNSFTNLRENATITSYDQETGEAMAGEYVFDSFWGDFEDFRFCGGGKEIQHAIRITQTGQTVEEGGEIYPLITMVDENDDEYTLIGAPDGEDWDDFWYEYYNNEFEIKIPNVQLGATTGYTYITVNGYMNADTPYVGGHYYDI